MDLQTLRSEKKIGILGYGINNKELVRFLASEGIACTVRDTRPELEKEFRSQFAELNDLVSWEVPKDILADLEVFSLVFRSPSIPFLSPALQKAAKKGVKIYSQTKLFFDLCPAPIIAVTGTKGKGTTSSLIHRVLEAGYKDGKTYLAGNIGLDPFSFYSKLTPEDVVILELSSFQIQDLHKGPYMAVLLTIGVDHLDHHASVEEYRQAKQRLALTQTEDDVLIVNVQQPEMMQYAKSARGALYCYSRHTPRRQSAWSLQEDGKEIVFVQVGGEIDSFDITPRKLKGEHNLDNILPAAIIGALYDIPMPVIQEAVCSFPGLEHRLSFVGSYSEVEFYDDSIATTPESCL
ncbi:MAG: UDP-N-acetylmuramoylalanine--D-glutamate ligase, UDP-N-acetylmuramoylalanine--D-glutamate ligase, partial [Patescibacteria group bacterium]|nr:UDP-N-acetylmuramoylalanine--D-glutamate ligase, UDP-N-acetylmuramoylalanine--D-glutamate ligase [Patescibacteria group bacterium]